VEALLIATMGVGSILLWLGIPLGWILLASQLSNRYPRIYIIALVACPITMVAFGWFLVRVNGLYMALFPDRDQLPRRGRAAWMQSVGADASTRKPLPVLETCMAISVALAFVAFLVWFFFFAGSSLPNP